MLRGLIPASHEPRNRIVACAQQYDDVCRGGEKVCATLLTWSLVGVWPGPGRRGGRSVARAWREKAPAPEGCGVCACVCVCMHVYISMRRCVCICLRVCVCAEGALPDLELDDGVLLRPHALSTRAVVVRAHLYQPYTHTHKNTLI